MPSTGSTKVATALGTFALLLFLFAQPMAATSSQPRIRVLILDGCSNYAFPGWPVYNQMIGLGWRNRQQGDAITINSRERLLRIPSGQGENTGNDGRSDVVVHRLGDHPIHHGMPRAWKTPTLEIYYYARCPAKHMRVLSYV